MWPIIVKEARQQFRIERSSSLIVAVVYLILCVVLFFINYALIGTYYVDLKGAFSAFWLHILALQYFVVHIVGSLKLSLSIVRDRSAKRYDFEVMSGISEWSSILGRLIGLPLFCYFLVALTVVFTLFCRFAGGISSHTILTDYVILLSSTFLFFSFAILASVVSRNPFSAMSSTLFFILLIYAIGLSSKFRLGELAIFSPLLPFTSVFQATAPETVNFAGAEFPSWAVCSSLYIFCAYWLLVSAARTLRIPKTSALSKPHAFVLLSLVQLIIVAFSSTASRNSNFTTPFLFVYLAFSFILILLFSFLLIKPPSSSEKSPYGRIVSGVLYSNGPFIPFFFLILITTLLILVFGLYKGHIEGLPNLSRGDFLCSIVMFLLMVLFYTLLVKFSITVAGEKGRLIAAFVFLILVTIPPALEVFNKESGYGLIQILNPLIVFASPIRETISLNLAVPKSTMIATALVLYGALSLILAAILKMWWGIRTPSEQSR